MLWAEGKFEAALQLEKLWNELSRTQSFHLRCAYSVGAFAIEQEAPFLKMCGEHTRVLPIGTAAPEIDGEELSRVGAIWHQKASLEIEIAGRKKLRRLCNSGNRNWQTCLKTAPKACSAQDLTRGSYGRTRLC